jgi:two-component system, cell cycle sensor histidine kinase and response regulator CckA
MQAPPPVTDETGRLEALARYQVLETPPERALDELTRVAAHVCQTPIALLTFLDAQRQWITARVGPAIPESPRRLAFCAHAIHAADLFIIADTLDDARFADQPLVAAEPHLRFYAATPLRTPDGHAIGTLAVADLVPRQLTDAQLDALRVLGRQAMAQLELRRLTIDAAGREASAQESLRHQGVQLDAALSVAGMGVWFADLRTGAIGRLRPGGPITGLPDGLSPTTSEAFMALVHPDDRASMAANIERATREGAYSGEFRIVLPGGEVRWVSSHGRCLFDADGTPTSMTGVDLDVTERKRDLERIRHLNRVYAVLSDINQAIVREPDLDRLLEQACRIVVERGGFRMAWLGLLDPDTGRLVRRACAGADDATIRLVDLIVGTERPVGCAFTERALVTGRPAACPDIAHDPEAETWRRAALERGYRSMAAFAVVRNGQPIGAFNIYADAPDAFDPEECRLLDELADDIAFAIGAHERDQERQRADDQRRAAEDRFRQLAETIQQVFWMTDVHGSLLYVSPAFETIFGRPCDSVAASPGVWMDAVHPDDRERVEQAAYARLRRGDYDEVYRIVRPDGAVRWIRDRAFHIYDDAGEVYRLVGTAADVTEQRQLEEQLQQAQKMEIVGRLAGGVAHDFNNLLTIINGMTDLVIGGLAEDDPTRSDLTQIRQAGERAAALTGRLLAVSRRQILKPEIVDLSAIVTSLQDMIQRLVGEDVALVLELSPELASVKADPGQIEQVVLNLVVNARDAMPDGGTLTIETRSVRLDAVSASEHPGMRPGPYALLAVSDTGVGMDDAIRRRIFEPFFTTKPQGKGTGLGLSMVYGIVKQSGGAIWFHSEPGHGTRFTICLPHVVGPPTARPTSPPTVTARGHETVLVVEDEPPLRALAARVLAGAGYTVLQAGSGAEALALIADHDPVHLVFTDVVMPGMNGRELVARLSALRPAMRVLYTSGYTEDAILRHGVLDDPRRFLSKPYTPALLRRRIREALD